MCVGILVANLRPIKNELGHLDWVIEDWVFLNGVRGLGHLELIRGLGLREPNTRIELIRVLGHLEMGHRGLGLLERSTRTGSSRIGSS